MIPLSPVSEAALAAHIEKLPALPTIANDLLASFDQDDIDVDTLARRISNDQSLAARTLRIANSPFYGLSGKVGAIPDAIVILGFRTVRSLVLSAAMAQSLGRVGNADFDAQRFWRHSTSVALFARGIARLCRENPEIAFTTGLIHDMGRVLLSTCFPEQYRQVIDWQRSRDCPTMEAERAVLGIDHCVAGGALARRWSLPANIAGAIARHHFPDGDTCLRLADICHWADVLAHALAPNPGPLGAVPPISADAWERLGLRWEQVPSLLRDVQRDLEETCLAFAT